MPPDIETAIAANRRRFITGIEAPLVRQALVDFARVLASVEREAGRLAERIADQGGTPTYAQTVRMEQLEALHADVQVQVTRILNRELGAILAARRTAAIAGGRDALALVRSVTPASASLRSLASERVMAAVGPDSPLRALIARMPVEAGQRVRDALVDGVVRGDNPRVTGAAVRRALNGQASRAMTIARTETMRAYRGAAVETYRANRDVVEGWVWVSAQDATTCAMCWAMHGTVHPLTETLDSHPNCIPAGAVVSGPRAVGSTARWYEGEVVELHTAGGHRLTVTPNHPVLTPEGWVAAGLLDVGRRVVSSSGRERPTPPIYPDDEQVPAFIEEVAESLGRASGVPVVSMPTAPEDFHGDGGGSEVHVVRANSLLGGGVDAALRQPLAHQQLCGRHAEAALLPRAGALHAFFERGLASSDGFMGGLDTATVLLGSLVPGYEGVGLSLPATRHASSIQAALDDVPRHTQGIGDGLLALALGVPSRDLGGIDGEPGAIVPDGYAALPQDAGDDLVGDAMPSREALARFAGCVVTDELVEVRRLPFAGHVYNLQTGEGWYIANNIITHNCRCVPGPLPATADPALAVRVSTGVEVFDTLPEATQLRILGPAALEAYQDGALELPDLVGAGSSAEWGRVRFRRSLSSVLGGRRARGYYGRAA